MDKEIYKNKNNEKSKLTDQYKIGKTEEHKSRGFVKAQISYGKRFQGKNSLFTEKLKIVSNTQELEGRIDKNFIKNQGPTIKILESIRRKSELDDNSKFDDLHSLLHTEDLLIIAHAEVMSNDGAMTGEPMEITVDKSSLKKIKNISKKIKKGTFEWTPSLYVEIPRPGKKPRPLGIPDYTDKIVQSAIKLILEAIYNPTFRKLNKSYGFISHKSCIESVNDIKHYKNTGLNIAIEGDIKEAFDNVNHETLRSILSKRIIDKKFINIIYKACKAGKLVKKKNKMILIPTDLGTQQGSIISPTLFNIYMHEFDLFIMENIRTTIESINANKAKESIHPTYKKYKSIIDVTSKETKKMQMSNLFTKLDKKNREKLKYYKIRTKTIKDRRFKIPYINPLEKKIRYYYNRYADDFIILTNSDMDTASLIKQKISTFLMNKLKLTLSEEKTTIVDIKHTHAKYLGFTIYISKKAIITQDDNKNTQRRGSGIIKIGIDMERRIASLKTKKFMSEKGQPRETPYLMSFEPQQIIDFYNSTIDGTINYYYSSINRKSNLNFLIYTYHFSCLKTLAAKFKSSIRKILIENGWPEYNSRKQPTNRIRLIWKYQVIDKYGKPKDKYTILRNYMDAMDQGKWVALNMRTFAECVPSEELIKQDYWNFYKLNWRTRFKYESCCTICGSEEKLQSHHIKKISGPRASHSALSLMVKLKRKQIIICEKCHQMIHQGKYNGTKLSQLAEIRTLRISNLLLSKPTSIDKLILTKSGIVKLQQYPDIGKYRSKPIILNLLERKIINYKDKAQKIQSLKTNKATLKKVNQKNT